MMQEASAATRTGSAWHSNPLQEEDSDEEAGFPEDDQTPFEAGAGVEDIMRMLEEGGTLPDLEGLLAAEDPQVMVLAPILAAIWQYGILAIWHLQEGWWSYVQVLIPSPLQYSFLN